MGEAAAARGGPGDFGARTLAGNFAFEPAHALDVEPRFGLNRDGQYVYGLVRDADGAPYCLYRKFELNGWSWALSVQTRDAAGQLRINRDVAGFAYRGRLDRSLVGDEARFRPDSITRQRGIELDIGPASIAWREDQAFALAGQQIGPGMQWYTPHDRGGGVLWLSVGYGVEGRFQGKPVRGFLFLDHAYLAPGLSYPNDPLIDGLEVRWNTFANWYEDGTIEVGHLACGHEHWGFALINDNRRGVLHATDKIHVRITEQDDAGFFPRRIESAIGPERERWLWTAEAGGDMIDFDRPNHPNSNGTERRADEQRRILVSMGWGETCPPHGTEAGHAR